MVDLAPVGALRAAGRHEEARELLLALAAAHPRDPQVQYEAACVHDFLGLEREAIPFYRAALAAGLRGEERRGAYLGLGSTFRCLGRYAEAAATLEAGLAEYPGALELQLFLAMARYNLGRHHEAVAGLLELVLATSTDPAIQGYARAIRLYAEDLDRVWEA